MKFSKKTMAIILAATVMNYNVPALMVYGNEVREDTNAITNVENKDNDNIRDTNELEKVTNNSEIEFNDNQVNNGDGITENSDDKYKLLKDDVMEIAVDVTAPVLDVSSLTVDKKEATVGDTVNISLEATDDISGIDYINVWYNMPKSQKYKNVRMWYDSSDNKYKGNLYIDENFESGKWTISWIYLKDNMQNEIYMYPNEYDFDSISFIVHNSNEVDITAPVLDVSSLTVDKKEATVGDTVNISLEATDDISGIDYINVWYNMPKSQKYKNVRMWYDSSDNKYKGNLYIDENFESGKWTISWIYLKDNMQNEIYMYPNEYDFDSISFIVHNSNEVDITAPVLDVSSLTVDKKQVTVGESVKLSFKATGDISGIKSAKIWYYTPVTRKSKGISMTYNKNTGLYEGYIDVNEMTEAGEWKIQYIYLNDSVSNQTYIYNSNIKNYGDIKENLSAGDFTVNETISDVTAPVLDISSLTVDKKEATVGDRVNLSFKATDNMSEIKYARIWYYTPTGKTKRILMTYNKNTGFYEGHIDIDKTTEIGEWKIQYVYLSDSVSNQSYIYNSNVKNYGDIEEDLSIGDFNIR